MIRLLSVLIGVCGLYLSFSAAAVMNCHLNSEFFGVEKTPNLVGNNGPVEITGRSLLPIHSLIGKLCADGQQYFLYFSESNSIRTFSCAGGSVNPAQYADIFCYQ